MNHRTHLWGLFTEESYNSQVQFQQEEKQAKAQFLKSPATHGGMSWDLGTPHVPTVWVWAPVEGPFLLQICFVTVQAGGPCLQGKERFPNTGYSGSSSCLAPGGREPMTVSSHPGYARPSLVQHSWEREKEASLSGEPIITSKITCRPFSSLHHIFHLEDKFSSTFNHSFLSIFSILCFWNDDLISWIYFPCFLIAIS